MCDNKVQFIKDNIKNYPDFPKKGIMFWYVAYIIMNFIITYYILIQILYYSILFIAPHITYFL